MNRKEILETYDVNDKGVIQTPGMFERQMLYAPYFHELFMDGGGYEDFDNDLVYFDVNDEDIKEFPELFGVKHIALHFDYQGFVEVKEV
jgi:hypothetical protein